MSKPGKSMKMKNPPQPGGSVARASDGIRFSRSRKDGREDQRHEDHAQERRAGGCVTH
jgi:hypothetical protein